MPLSRAGRAIAATAAVCSLLAIGWLAWITVNPEMWLADAYAEKGPPGDQGLRGPTGPPGPPGPTGPDAADAIASVESEREDISARVEELESGSGTTELQSAVDDLTSRVEDLETALGDLCSAISTAYTFSEAGSAVEDAFFELNNAC